MKVRYFHQLIDVDSAPDGMKLRTGHSSWNGLNVRFRYKRTFEFNASALSVKMAEQLEMARDVG